MTILLCFVIALNLAYLCELYNYSCNWYDQEFWTEFVISINCLSAIAYLFITIIGG